jgi:protein-disulfide isomerase
MSKQFWAVIAAIVIVLIGIFVFTGKKSDSGSKSSSSTTTNHVEGKGTTGVKLVEYGDYQCPYCQVYSATVKQVVADYGDKITFQFVNFPLTSLHQNAFAAARAAEAAGKQNKYWEMHDLLYQNNDPNGASGWVASTSPTTYFNQFATQIGLDLTKFKTDYASSAVNDAINADMAAGNKLGVDSTPNFILDGKKVQINNSVDDFKKAIDAAIKKQASTSTATPAQ